VKKENFEELLLSIKQAGEIMRGKREPSRVFRYASIEVKKIRAKLNLTQAEFAKMICVSPATLRNWEQGRTYPEGAAIALLRVADANPQAVLEALHPKAA
jgi:putative transcriptional regulator